MYSSSQPQRSHAYTPAIGGEPVNVNATSDYNYESFVKKTFLKSIEMAGVEHLIKQGFRENDFTNRAWLGRIIDMRRGQQEDAMNFLLENGIESALVFIGMKRKR